MIKVFTDGGSRGNPGPSAIGVYAVDENNNEIFSLGEKIGHATNNVAEYKAVIAGLSWILENKNVIDSNKEINFFLDSKLVCCQAIGVFKIKDAKLRELLFKIRELEAQINAKINYTFIEREKNKEADKLVNMALDGKI